MNATMTIRRVTLRLKDDTIQQYYSFSDPYFREGFMVLESINGLVNRDQSTIVEVHAEPFSLDIPSFPELQNQKKSEEKIGFVSDPSVLA